MFNAPSPPFKVINLIYQIAIRMVTFLVRKDVQCLNNAYMVMKDDFTIVLFLEIVFLLYTHPNKTKQNRCEMIFSTISALINSLRSSDAYMCR